ncbi:MAG TPA: phosphatase PAP2 family protein [Acidimicrobiales bacterium]|nr:phosphatase PAP2 family protein [Acidimicrobiales bacterium]
MTPRLAPQARLGIAGAVVVVVGGAIASGGPVVGEVAVVEAVNDLPRPAIETLEVVMQLGARGAIVLVALVAAVLADRRRLRVAVAVLLAGAAAWFVNAQVKDVVDRPRPAGVGAEVEVLDEARGLGYPSSHVAVAAASLVAAALGTRRPVGAALALAAVVGLARMAVGVHLPLDVVGGLGLGACAAALAAFLALR